jgi:hypothetical protein
VLHAPLRHGALEHDDPFTYFDRDLTRVDVCGLHEVFADVLFDPLVGTLIALRPAAL